MQLTNAIRAVVVALLMVVLVTAAGCAAVAGIFKAGMWVGIVMAVIVLGLVFFLISRLTGR
jgi:hypothetical protein